MSPDEYVFLPYQRRFISEKSTYRVSVKSRRIGITWAVAADAVLSAAAAGGCSVKYTSYKLKFTKEFIQTCSMWARHFQLACAERIVDDNGELVEGASAESFVEGKGQLKYELHFPSGYMIQGVSSNPVNLRGGPDDKIAIIDEAAHLKNLPECMKAADGYKIWGGHIFIISTHNGKNNPFNKLVEDIKKGKKSKRGVEVERLRSGLSYADKEHADSSVVYRNGAFSLHTCCLYRAFGEGLYKRICMVSRKKHTPEKEKAELEDWLETDGAGEEYTCVPGNAAGGYFSPELIASCVDPRLSVVRLNGPKHPVFEVPVTPDDPVERELILDEWRERRCRWVEKWLERHVDPLTASLDISRPHYVGEDFARVSDLTVLAVGQVQQNLVLKILLVVEIVGVQFANQRQIVSHILGRLPRFSGGAFDKGGNGADMAEAMANRFGGRRKDGGAPVIEQIQLSEQFYSMTFPSLRDEMERGLVVLPADEDISTDMSIVEVIGGTPRIPPRKTKSEKMTKVQRHGDAAIAINMCAYKARTTPCAAPLQYMSERDLVPEESEDESDDVFFM